MNEDEQVVYFGETDARNRRLKFGIKKKDRSRHMYAIGKTGMGKSTLLENLAVQDILNGDGLCFIDPHGKSADLLLEYVPEHRIKDVIYFAPFDMEYPVSFNVMEDVGPERRYLVASGLMAAFKKIWVDAWSARMEYILGNIMLALLEYPGSTLVGVNRMLTDKDFRKEVVNNITDPSVKSFWVNEYANYTDKFAAEAAPAIQNKVGQFIANPLIRNIIGQEKSSFDIRDVMDNKKILIINLSKGRVGEANANLLGSMLITKIYLGAMSRADLSEKQLAEAPNFYLYVDEFQSFANESFADILSEARKYKLNLCIAHQYIEQMTDEVRAAVFGNVGTMVAYRVGAYDAEILEKEFAPFFTAEDIVNLQKYQMYLKLMIDGVTSKPFSASGMPPIPKPEQNNFNAIIDSSRKLYARPRKEVEEELLAWIQKKFGGSGSSNSSNSSSGSNNSSSNGGSSQKNSFQKQNDARSNSQYQSNQRGRDKGFQESRDSRNQKNSASLDRDQEVAGVHGNRQQSRPVQTNQDRMHIKHSGASHKDVSGHNDNPAVRTNSSTQLKHQTEDVRADKRNIEQKQSMNSSEREQQFRDAISLSYLKPEPPKTQDKEPKPENLSALRDALLAVMKKEDFSIKPESQAQATTKMEQTQVSEPARTDIDSSVSKSMHENKRSDTPVHNQFAQRNEKEQNRVSSESGNVSNHRPQHSQYQPVQSKNSETHQRPVEDNTEDLLKEMFKE